MWKIYIYIYIFIHSFLSGHLRCFHVLAIVNSAVLGCMNVFKSWFSLDIRPLDFLNLLPSFSKRFSIGIVAIYWLSSLFLYLRASWVAQMVKNIPVIQDTCVRSLGQEDSPGEVHGNPLQYSCLEKSMDRGAWQAWIHGIAKSWIRLSE